VPHLPNSIGENYSVEAPKVLVVSDVRLYRDGLAAILASTKRVNIIGAIAQTDLGSCFCESDNVVPADVVLIDMSLLNGGAKSLNLRQLGATKAIAFAVANTEDDFLTCARSGLSGFVSKDASAEDIVEAILGALRGELTCPSNAVGLVFRHFAALSQMQSGRRASGGLTDREFEIARLLDRGCSNKEIARQLDISPTTVKNHVHNILEKLAVHRRGEAAAVLRGMLAAASSLGQDWLSPLTF
jgi:two-component system nitrate/nitrite response regulator NarL